jgi:hypothetical protein
MGKIELDEGSSSGGGGGGGGGTNADGTKVENFRFRGCCHPQGTLEKDGFLLTADEIQKAFARMPLTTILDNHDRDKPVGRVEASWVEDGRLMITGSFFPHENGRKAMQQVREGKYRGLSLGCRHRYDPIGKRVKKTRIQEVSVCEEGQIDGTSVNTIASRSHAHDTATTRNPIVTMVLTEKPLSSINDDRRGTRPPLFLILLCLPKTRRW